MCAELFRALPLQSDHLRAVYHETIAKAGFIGFAWIRSQDSSLAGNVQETIAAIDYVKNLKNVDVERLAVIGFSRGGLLAFMASV